MTKEVTVIAQEFIEKEDLKLQDLHFFKSINDIVLSKKLKLSLNPYQVPVSFDESYMYVLSFFKTIGNEYSTHFNEILENQILETPVAISKNEALHAYSTYSPETKERAIVVPLIDRIMDTYTLVHEVLHDTNIPKDLNPSLTRNLFTETVSMLGELLLEDYYRAMQKPPKEFKINKKDTLYSVYYKASLIDIQLKILDSTIKDESLEKSLFANRSYYEQFIINETIEKTIGNQFNYDYLFRYVLGILLASLIHQEMLDKEADLKTFTWLNENMNTKSIEEIFGKLGLELEEKDSLSLTNQSMKKLRYAYSREIKRK